MTKLQIADWLTAELEAVLTFVQANDPAQCTTKPAGKWSVADHLEHLTLSMLPLESRMPFPLESLAGLGTPDRPSFAAPVMIEKYTALLQTGLKAPARFDPDEQPGNDDFATILARFEAIHRSFLQKLTSWDDADLDRYWMKHPAMGLITVREMLLFMAFHVGHHRKGMGDCL